MKAKQLRQVRFMALAQVLSVMKLQAKLLMNQQKHLSSNSHKIKKSVKSQHLDLMSNLKMKSWRALSNQCMQTKIQISFSKMTNCRSSRARCNAQGEVASQPAYAWSSKPKEDGSHDFGNILLARNEQRYSQVICHSWMHEHKRAIKSSWLHARKSAREASWMHERKSAREASWLHARKSAAKASWVHEHTCAAKQVECMNTSARQKQAECMKTSAR